MRFITPAQTLSEHKHREMPVFETLGLSAGSAALLGGALAGAGSIGAGLLANRGGKSVPSFNPLQALAYGQSAYDQMAPKALSFGSDLYNQASKQGIDFAQRGTQANIANQEAVTPGSQAQRETALNQINAYITGQVPQDVQQNIQRQVAQNLGGGFSTFTGGGQAQGNFARNIGQTSLGLSQFGLSAAPTWQQLANSMVVNPAVGLQAGLQAAGVGAGIASSAYGLGNQLAESQYQSGINQYLTNQAQNQYNAGLLNTGIGTGINAYSAINQGNYYNNLLPSMQGRLATTGTPAASQYYSNPITNAGVSDYRNDYYGLLGQ